MNDRRDTSTHPPIDEGSRALGILIAEACAAPFRSVAAERTISRLQALADRLEGQRLHLAVLGQFKRGKSTLLNALLGAPALPMAVTPLTAIPTFIAFGEHLHLRTFGIGGETEDIPVADIDALHAELKARVTEEANPRNRLGLARVEVSLPAELLRKGIVLLDTPGIGSTYLHNTETAEAILPECDAALFVVSPDPPITAAELEYLARIRATAPRVILVLNKIDIVEGEDRNAAIEFLRRLAEQTADLKGAPLFSVSARTALRAKLVRDAEGLRASGIGTLEHYLTDFIGREKARTLDAAIATKAEVLIGELQFELESRLAALRMPIDQLSQSLLKFDQAADRFRSERNMSSDLIAGDRRRLLADLDVEADRLREQLKTDLAGEMDLAIGAGEPEDAVLARLAERIPLLFQAESESQDTRMRQRFVAMLRVHQQRADALIGSVRRAAADLLQIGYTAPAVEDAFDLKRIPYWVTQPRETMRLLPPGTFETLLPGSHRRHRMRMRLLAQLDDILRRNVENLRWSMRQNLEDGFRAFELQLDEQLQLTLAATREAFQLGMRRRTEESAGAHTEIDALGVAVGRLRQLREALGARAAASEGEGP